MSSPTADAVLTGALRAHYLDTNTADVMELAESLCGLHNTNQSTPFLSVRARLPGFTRPELETVMWDEWRAARFRAMRLTIFVFPIDLLEIAASATRHLRERFAERWLRDSRFTATEMNALAADVEEALSSGPMTVRALRRELSVGKEIDLPGVVGRMCDVGRLVGGQPPRSWRSGVREYHLWGSVLPSVDPNRWTEKEAVRELIGRYVTSYGPVTIDDISWWTGFTKTRCREALQSLDLPTTTVDGWPGPLWHSNPIEGEPSDRVYALPLLDPYPQGYRDRVRFLDPDRNEWVYDWGGNAAATLVHRGRIIGVWQFAEKPERAVLYHFFERQPAKVRRDAEEELAATGDFFFDRRVDVREVKEMSSLRADGGRSAAHPLDGKPHRARRG